MRQVAIVQGGRECVEGCPLGATDRASEAGKRDNTYKWFDSLRRRGGDQ